MFSCLHDNDVCVLVLTLNIYCVMFCSVLEHTCRLLHIANKYWNTTVPSLTANTPNTHVIPMIGNNIHILLKPVLQTMNTCYTPIEWCMIAAQNAHMGHEDIYSKSSNTCNPDFDWFEIFANSISLLIVYSLIKVFM